jgi:hypothetical protein
MLRYFGNRVSDALEDVDYFGKRSLAYMAGKAGIEFGKEASNGFLVAAAPNALAGYGKYMGLAVAAPVSVGLSAFFVQKDYQHRKDRILDQYREEIGSWLGKDPAKLKQEDLELAAKGDYLQNIPGNPALKQALESAVDQRDLGFVVSGTSTLLTTGIAFAAKHSVHDWAKELLSTTSLSGSELAIGLLTAAGLGAIGYGVYLGVKAPMHWLAEKFVGVEKVTVDDRIHEMRRTLDLGKMVSQEKVMQTFIEAHPDMDQDIKQRFGKHFAKMDAAGKREVMLNLGPQIGLLELTQDINLGVVRPEELAWRVFGQQSGVLPKDGNEVKQAQPGYLSRAWKHCCAAVRGAIGTHEKEALVSEASPAAVQLHAASTDGNAELTLQAYAEDKPQRQTSFVQMVGKRRGQDGSMSFVEQVEHSRTGEVQI